MWSLECWRRVILARTWWIDYLDIHQLDVRTWLSNRDKAHLVHLWDMWLHEINVYPRLYTLFLVSMACLVVFQVGCVVLCYTCCCRRSSPPVSMPSPPPPQEFVYRKRLREQPSPSVVKTLKQRKAKQSVTLGEHVRRHSFTDG